VSTARAQRLVLERLGTAETVLVSLHLALPAMPAWADGVDREGRAVLLVGGATLRALPEGESALGAVLEGLRAGDLPAGVHGVAFQPRASEALAEILDGEAAEICVWGSRASGKTMLAAASFLGLAELHLRAGFAAPLRVAWLHGSLVDASAKTGRSLEEPLWDGLWQLRDDRRVAVASLGGREMVLADLVGVHDPTTKERLRVSVHAIGAEEVVGTLDEAGGIPEREYAVALTSTLRLEGRRRVAVLTTNPGSREHWAYARFLAQDHERSRVAVHVPSRDRLNAEQISAQAAPFRDAADLRARLVEETWTDLKLGPEVAVGYTPSRHVAAAPQWLVPHAPLWIGWDTSPGSHVHAAVICQRNGPQIRVFAALAMSNCGLKQLIDQQVLPWLVQHAKWVLGKDNAREYLTHVLDPAAAPHEGGDADQNAERRIRESLGGRIRFGVQHWQPRIGPLLAVLSDNSDVTLKIDPGPACDLLRRALAGLWHYDMTRGGTVERDAPAKNERIFADVGEALCYVLGEMRPSRRSGPRPRPNPATVIELVNGVGLMPDRRRPVPKPSKRVNLHNNF
jgi:hypothetical protein